MEENIKILTDEEIQERMKDFPGWLYFNDKISKEFKFKEFLDAVDFINKIAPQCEKINHHPDIHIFYNRILFELQRFDVGGKVTDKDFLVAGEIERLYESVSKPEK
jgi:4a-hydroxytetrahydrobiopterin dehydratase